MPAVCECQFFRSQSARHPKQSHPFPKISKKLLLMESSNKNEGQLKRLCSLRDKKREADWVADSECIWCVRWHPSGDLIASCRGRLIRLWSISSHQHPIEGAAEEAGGRCSGGDVDTDGAEKEWRCHVRQQDTNSK